MLYISVISSDEQERSRIISCMSVHGDLRISGTGKDGYDVIKTAENLQPDIIIMEMWVGDICGISLVPIILRKSPVTKLIMICSPDDGHLLKQAIRTGISGFLLRQTDADEMLKAIMAVHNDGYYLHKQARSHAYNYLPGTDYSFPKPAKMEVRFHKSKSGGACPAEPGISSTEQNILTRIARGYSDREIAKELCIATGTVRNCLGAIKRRTGQKSRAQLILYSLLHGLINFLPRN